MITLNPKFTGAAALLLALLSGGCATTTPGTQVTYYSDPPGGAICITINGARKCGLAPYTVTYPNAHSFEGCLDLQAVEVTWKSGATKPANARVCKEAPVWNLTVKRPEAPGHEIDSAFAVDIAHQQQMRAQRQNSAPAQDNEISSWLEALSNIAVSYQEGRNQAYSEALESKKNQINCTSRTYGSTTRTNCQ